MTRRWPYDVNLLTLVKTGPRNSLCPQTAELFLEEEVTAITAADALWRHTCRFTAPLELINDFGSQFVNDLLTHFHQDTGIKHHTTIPCMWQHFLH